MILTRFETEKTHKYYLMLLILKTLYLKLFFYRESMQKAIETQPLLENVVVYVAQDCTGIIKLLSTQGFKRVDEILHILKFHEKISREY